MIGHFKVYVYSLELSKHEAVYTESLNVYSNKYFSFLQPHRLAHDIGAGAPCLTCGDTCPGLDLHFWRYAADETYLVQNLSTGYYRFIFSSLLLDLVCCAI